MSAVLPHTVWPWCEFKMRVWNSLKIQDAKTRQKSTSGHHHTTLSGYIFATKAHIDSRKKVLSSNISSTCSHNMVHFVPLAAEIGSIVWGTPPNFSGFRVLAVLLHGILVVGVSQTLRRWTEGATYTGRPSRSASAHILVYGSPICNRQTIYIFILFLLSSFFFSSPNPSGRRLGVCHTSTHGMALVRI